jgi:hypothetical protein
MSSRAQKADVRIIEIPVPGAGAMVYLASRKENQEVFFAAFAPWEYQAKPGSIL